MCSINTRLQLEEDLDTADPLRHYFSSADTTYVTPKPIDALFPLQRPAVLKQITQLSFGNNIDIPISISLAVDASPGCGGIAWPAGQVNFFHFYVTCTTEVAEFLTVSTAVSGLGGISRQTGAGVLER